MGVCGRVFHELATVRLTPEFSESGCCKHTNLGAASTLFECGADLRNLLSIYVPLDADKSFYLITDAQGQTVAQYIQEVQDDFSTYPPLPREQLEKTKFRPVSLPIGIILGDIPIVQNVLSNQRPLSGAELFKSEWLKRFKVAQG